MVLITAGLSLLAYGAAVVMFVLLHLRDPDNNIRSDAVSDYANGRAARLFLIYGIAGAIGAALLSVAILLHPGQPFPNRVPVLLMGSAILRIGVLRYPTDPGGVARTRQGKLHLALAVGTFALIYMVVAGGTPTAVRLFGPALAGVLTALSWIAALSLIAVVVTRLPALARFFGLAERLFLLSTALWCLCVAGGLALGG